MSLGPVASFGDPDPKKNPLPLPVLWQGPLGCRACGRGQLHIETITTHVGRTKLAACDFCSFRQWWVLPNGEGVSSTGLAFVGKA